MTFKSAIPVLRIFNEAKAKEFYVEFLGFSVDWEHRVGENFPLYQSVSLGGCVLHLSEHHGDCSPDGAVRIEASNVRALREALHHKDYKYAKPGVNRQPWGTDEMSITDPFGNRLTFYTPVA